MKKTLAALALALAAATAVQASEPLWMRYGKISPDGTRIAFSYKGDIYVVPAAGGEALRLTATPSFETCPVWSPDSRTVAFQSDREGSLDIYTVPAKGGQAVRVTTYSGTETPLMFTPDGKELYYSAAIQNPAESSMFPAGWFTQLYKVSAVGGRSHLVTAAPVCGMDLDKDGKSFIYYNRNGSENIWRKHHTSSVTRDIFYYDAEKDVHTPLCNRAGEDREPLFTPNGKVVFLSERDGGSFNVYKADRDDFDKAERLTSFTKHPVRFLSRADNGTLCFGYQGEIYTMVPGGQPAKVSITITEDNYEKPTTLRPGSASGISISDNGKDIALLYRGEVFATTDKYGTTRQITATAAAERGISMSPDGKTIVYASERTGTWSLYKATMGRKEDLHFANATTIVETPLFKEDGIERTSPSFSPDGKEIAFIENRHLLKVLNLASGKVRQITDGTQHYGNSEGGFDYDWSPDGKWFALTLITNRRDPYTDVGIVSASGDGKIHNITNSAYIDGDPQWVMDGNALLFTSNRYGMRSHASWGSQDDVFIAFMNRETMEKFLMNEEEAALAKEADKAAEDAKKESAKKDDSKKESASDKKKKAAKTGDKKDGKNVEIEFEGLEDRVLRLTPMSSSLASAALSKDGETLYFLSSFEGGFDLWKKQTRTGKTSLVQKLNSSYASLAIDKDGKNLYVMSSRPSVISLPGGSPMPISFNIEMELDKAAEREYMFNHVINQEIKRFYSTDYHGVDLEALRKDYQPFLEHINNNYDFSELLSEVLGELNVSHTGSGYRAPAPAKPTAETGLLFDMKYAGKGLKVDEVVDFGPFDKVSSKVAKGTVVESIDGTVVGTDTDWFALLNGKAGKTVLFGLWNPQTGEHWEETAKLISKSRLNNLLYDRWVKSRAAEVERLSGGRLGYVHLKSMNDGSYRDIYSDILGKYNLKDGIVIDTRFNGGGRLHEDIEILFSGQKYLEQVIRGTVACDMPSRRYNKQSIMLVGEANYSNAHGTPWVYRHKKMGSIVGMPVPGTMTSVNWETLQDPSLYFGIPVIGYRTKDGTYLENSQLEPDFKVRNVYNETEKGRDAQLEKAVEELLRQIDANHDRW